MKERDDEQQERDENYIRRGVRHLKESKQDLWQVLSTQTLRQQSKRLKLKVEK